MFTAVFGYDYHALLPSKSPAPCLGPFISKDFLSKFPYIYFEVCIYLFFAQFFVRSISIFPPPKKIPNIGKRSVPNILPSVKFPNFGNVSCFSCFFCFSWEKKEEKLGKKSCSIRTALTTRYKDDACGQNINISGGGTLSVLRPLVFSPSLLPSKKHQHRFRMRYNDDACG